MKVRASFISIIGLWLFAMPLAARAQVTISLPMAGYYRPGRYMPLHVVSNNTRKLELRQDGVLPLDVVGLGFSADAILPALILIESPSEIVHVRTDDGVHDVKLSLRALAVNEKLVGVVGRHSAFSQWLFPNQEVIPVPLDPAKPLPGPAAAWELLDAIVVEGPWPAGIDPAAMHTLLAAGTVLAVRSATVPDSMWPWAQVGDYWIIRYTPVGPESVVLDSAYAPVSGWTPGTPAWTRGRVLGLAALFCFVVVGATLLRGKIVLLILLGVTAITVPAVGWWLTRLPPVREARGAIVTSSGPLIQRDLWMYETATRPSRAAVTWRGSLRPILASIDQVKKLRLKIECGGDGSPGRITMDLDPDTTMAFTLKMVMPVPNPPVVADRKVSALQTVARDLYEGPGISIAGEEAAPAPDPRKPEWVTEWPAVILKKGK